MPTLESLQKDIDDIKARNTRVEKDKVWETSWSRRVSIFMLTYFVIVVFFMISDLPHPLLNAFVPAFAFVVSTLTLGFAKKIWMENTLSKTSKMLLACLLLVLLGTMLSYASLEVSRYEENTNEFCWQTAHGFPFVAQYTVEQNNFTPAAALSGNVFVECIPTVPRAFLWEAFAINALAYSSLIALFWIIIRFLAAKRTSRHTHIAS
ncbi:MAG: hypothetical protein A2898_03570 [Candidatus Kerfeldbacteria bacterium RIFCSPLOWO2_01_FULL_48_11]|uniref:Uncharacterized protein n=1 Tax=Candidatus Kerfeldbacteria bacterium RIFCSPLOWO2_01_FULL_48_11 TaxID=1798543 RepID=A0A1G2B2F2_9BACT|nr:MAG: hypothetical protein UY34_C0010G0021 [Parcubacteria group bacterium GW2011_GWA2_48_9]KKW16271.1 MAG: hypothetical protein UY52_C0007G0031 [Parcubacteria group bacterium GW2011_GWC2_49_9]OGY83338.1 MAG: hypothetical protein A2898_03570 [Candidatus Kerfeldbacteria bacterium RIFCSPLOWO2_01_FULL_48_11]